MEQLIKIIAICLFTGLLSCKKENRKDCLKSHGKQITEIRHIENYNYVSIKNHVNVVIKPGVKNEIEIAAGKNIIPMIYTEVKDDTLFIDDLNVCNWVRTYKREIGITLYRDSLAGIYTESSGELTSEDTLFAKTFTLEGMKLNGDVNLTLNAGWVNCFYHTGTSNLTLNGKTDYANYYTAGNGYIFARNLKARKSYVDHFGSGDVHVYGSNEFEAMNYRTGNIYFYGDPLIADYQNQSTGKVFKK